MSKWFTVQPVAPALGSWMKAREAADRLERFINDRMSLRMREAAYRAAWRKWGGPKTT